MIWSLLSLLLWSFMICAVVILLFKYRYAYQRRFIESKETIRLLDGRILVGPDKILGQGGFGVVAQYRLSKDGKTSAVAVKKPHFEKDNDLQEREICMLKAAAGSGSHKHIIRLLAEVKVKQKIYIVLEFMRGSVRDLLHDFPHLSWETKQSLAKQMLTGIAHLHGISKSLFKVEAIVHQDLKPDNLLVNKIEDSKDIRLKISDFGMAKRVDEFSLPLLGKLATVPHPGPVGGTLQYMAPEVVKMLSTQEQSHTERASDIFSAGVILWELATGRKPERSKKELSTGSFTAFENDKVIGNATWMRGKKTVAYCKSQFFGPMIEECIQEKPYQRSSATKLLSDLEGLKIP